MDILNFLLVNLLNGLMGIGFLILGYEIFSWITKWNFREVLDDEKEKGISGGSIVIAAFFIGLAIIVAAAAF